MFFISHLRPIQADYKWRAYAEWQYKTVSLPLLSRWRSQATLLRKRVSFPQKRNKNSPTDYIWISRFQNFWKKCLCWIDHWGFQNEDWWLIRGQLEDDWPQNSHLPNSSLSWLLATACISPMVPQEFPMVCFMKYTLGLTSCPFSSSICFFLKFSCCECKKKMLISQN